MLLTQREINDAYVALGNISLKEVAPADIVKIMKARQSMASHFERYMSINEGVRTNHEHYDLLLELEQKDKARTEAEEAQYNELLPTFLKDINAALEPELTKEYAVEVEPISEEAVAQIVSINGLSLEALEVIKCIVKV